VAKYDYIAGKRRIVEILENRLEVIDSNELPSEESFTYSNSYTSWITAIFVDIRKSLDLFSNEDKVLVSKVIRSFTSEVIEIFRKSDNLREIGVRGDCVYAMFTTPSKDDILDVADMAFYANTFMTMLNELLEEHDLPSIRVGIGLSAAKDLVVKAGRKDTGINSMVWIGESATKASKLSGVGNKGGYAPIVLSSTTYSNIIDALVKGNGDIARSWFSRHYDAELGTFYGANIIKTGFNEWIQSGMKE